MPENEFTLANKTKGLPAQQILDAGLNVFALQLLIESFTDLAGSDTTPLEFKFQGINIKLQIAEK